MKSVKHILTALTLCIAMISCNTSDDPQPGVVLYSIVTYEGSSSDGMRSTLTFQVNNDSEVITYTTMWTPPEGTKPGDRLLIAYTTESNALQSGTITVLSYANIPCGQATYSNAIPSSESINLNALWRTGNYLNLDCYVTISGQASEIALYIDQRTIDSSEPQAYIIIGHGNGPQPTEAPRRLYASWNIEQLWQQPSLSSLKINFIDFSNNLQSYIITK